MSVFNKNNNKNKIKIPAQVNMSLSTGVFALLANLVTPLPPPKKLLVFLEHGKDCLKKKHQEDHDGLDPQKIW